MWPLLRRDGLALQYSVMMVFWGWLMGVFGGKWSFSSNTLGKMVQVGGYLGIVMLHCLEIFVENTSLLNKLFEGNSIGGQIAHLDNKIQRLLERFPDLIVVGNVFVCFCAFAWMYLWTVGRLWNERLREGPGESGVGAVVAGGGKRKRE